LYLASQIAFQGKKNMPPDPNWLLSTIVQSAAAFVAIIAGFIISRLLALSSDKSGLEARIRDLEVQLTVNEQNITPLQKRLLEWDARNFLEHPDVFKKIIESEGKISLTDVMNGTTAHKRSIDELQPYWDAEIEETKKAFQLIREHISEIYEGIQDLETLLKKFEPNLSHHSLSICYGVYAFLRKEYYKKRNPFDAILGSVVESLPTSASLTGILPDVNLRLAEINNYRALQEEIEKFERERNALETLSVELKNQLKRLSLPKGINQGIAVLVWFALTGIVLPVVFLPIPPEQFTPIHKWIISGFFLSDLVAFFVYFIWLIR
jgi:prefoldin subunit 5